MIIEGLITGVRQLSPRRGLPPLWLVSVEGIELYAHSEVAEVVPAGSFCRCRVSVQWRSCQRGPLHWLDGLEVVDVV